MITIFKNSQSITLKPYDRKIVNDVITAGITELIQDCLKHEYQIDYNTENDNITYLILGYTEDKYKINIDIPEVVKQEFYQRFKGIVENYAIPYIDEEIEKEKNAKRQLFINRVKKIAGNIQDATSLKIGQNGEINGIVIGDYLKMNIWLIIFHIMILKEEKSLILNLKIIMELDILELENIIQKKNHIKYGLMY